MLIKNNVSSNGGYCYKKAYDLSLKSVVEGEAAFYDSNPNLTAEVISLVRANGNIANLVKGEDVIRHGSSIRFFYMSEHKNDKVRQLFVEEENPHGRYARFAAVRTR